MSVPRRFRPLAVLLYAAFIGLLLASYIAPLDAIIDGRSDVAALERDLREARTHNTVQQRLIEDLNTPAGIERAARERYGMIKPGEKVYIVE
jgi:cell division protein FtsB